MVQFKRKSTKTLKKAINQPDNIDPADIIKYGLNNENVARQIEENNTLVFICDIKATKPMIKKACQELYGCKVKKVNTLITPKGRKKAYIKLQEEGEAVNVASKVGII
ncbi:60S ribosomal protein L23A [Binucleata daphniae]